MKQCDLCGEEIVGEALYLSLSKPVNGSDTFKEIILQNTVCILCLNEGIGIAPKETP